MNKFVIKVPKIYLEILNSIIFLFIVCLVPIVLNTFINDIFTYLKINATILTLIKSIYIVISYIIMSITSIRVMLKIYTSTYLLLNTKVKLDYYEIKIKLPKLIKKDANIGKYK